MSVLSYTLHVHSASVLQQSEISTNTCAYQCCSVSLKSSYSSVTDCLFQAQHMKSIRRCWNVLHGSEVDLLRRDGHSEGDRSAGKWVSVVSQLVMVSAGLHHLAAELVRHQHLLQFHPTKFLDYCFVKSLNDIKRKQKYSQQRPWKYFFPFTVHSRGTHLHCLFPCV